MLMGTSTRPYKRVINARSSANLACFVFLLPQFRDLPFCFITDEFVETRMWLFPSKGTLELKSQLFYSFSKKTPKSMFEIVKNYDYEVASKWILLILYFGDISFTNF